MLVERCRHSCAHRRLVVRCRRSRDPQDRLVTRKGGVLVARCGGTKIPLTTKARIRKKIIEIEIASTEASPDLVGELIHFSCDACRVHHKSQRYIHHLHQRV